MKWTTRATGFYAAAICTMVAMAPCLFPMDLAALEFRLHPVAAVAGTTATIGVIALLVWVYLQLRRSPEAGTVFLIFVSCWLYLRSGACSRDS